MVTFLRKLLVLSLLLLQQPAAVLPSATHARFACTETVEGCQCLPSGENEFQMRCATPPGPASGAGGAFELVVQPGDLVRVQCKNVPAWSDFLLGSTIPVGPVSKLVLAACEAPRGADKILRQMRASGVEYLKYDGMTGALKNGDLNAFPGLKYFVLTNSHFNGVDVDILKGLENLLQFELRSTNIQIPVDFFSHSNKLRTLEISSNNLKDLSPGVFNGLTSIELLNIWKNDFQEFHPDVFRGLTTLVSLDIHQNNLKTLPVEIFQDLRSLEVINFSSNNFTSLPAGIFRHNSKLRVVKMLYNKANLTELPSGFLGNLTNLRTVSLMRSGILSVPEDLIWGSSKLLEINLNRNYLKILPAKLLKDATELHTLTASFNDLKELPNGVFASAKKLVKLDLSKNLLTSIKERTFMGLGSLQELNVESNDLTFIHVDAFVTLEELKIARFANNKLTLQTSLFDIFGQVSPFHPCSALEELYLSHNNITELYSDWIVSNTRLRVLDLSYNSFTFLETEDFQFVSNSVNVDLRHNSIRRVDLSRLEYISANQSDLAGAGSAPLVRDVTVHLGRNPLDCDCELYSLLRYADSEMHPRALSFVRLDLNELSCAGPDYVGGARLEDLHAASHKCLVRSDESHARQRPGDPCAPDSACDCWLRPADKSLLIDCANRNLTTAPAWIDSKGIECVELDLGGNELRYAPDTSASGYENLCSLNLANNRIETVGEGLIVPNLKILHLDGNNITSMQSNVLKKLAEHSNISRLALHDNPWRCDCGSLELLSFVQSNFLEIPDLLHITCSGTNVSLSNLSTDELCPSLDSLVITTCALVSFIGFLVGCTTAVYFRFQQQIKVWLYSKNLCLCLVTEDEIDRDKTYDAFISYSHKDEDFVVKELMARLEDGPKPYKLCIHVRDWLAGEWIPTQIARSVEESRRTIVVLSPNFIESVWGRLEFQTAHKRALSEKRARVIVVLYGDVGPVENLDPELRVYLQMNTYVKWGDPWFWQKLRYAMPHSVHSWKTQGDVENVSVVSKAITEKTIEEMKFTVVDEESGKKKKSKCKGLKWTFINEEANRFCV